MRGPAFVQAQALVPTRRPLQTLAPVFPHASRSVSVLTILAADYVAASGESEYRGHSIRLNLWDNRFGQSAESIPAVSPVNLIGVSELSRLYFGDCTVTVRSDTVSGRRMDAGPHVVQAEAAGTAITLSQPKLRCADEILPCHKPRMFNRVLTRVLPWAFVNRVFRQPARWPIILVELQMPIC